MKVIIIQPMKDKTEEQIKTERAALVKIIEERGDEVIDMVYPDFPAGKNKPLGFLARSLAAISDVDKVVFMPGWDSSRGCIIEHTACRSYGITVEYATGNDTVWVLTEV